MGNPKTATNKSGAASSRETSPKSGARRFSSSSDLWPEVAPEESSRRAVHRKKSLSTSRDQLLYLQALFPYAPYDELMSVISKTDGPDEAAQHAYEALNPNYTGYLYLKEQTEVMTNAKATKAQRATAFSGLREALEERASDAFRPGMFSNLSQLQEYHETVGLFAVDTTEWDRAMLLPARDLAEMAFMDLPLREEASSSSSAASSDAEGDDARNGGSDQHGRARLLSLALGGSNARFMDNSFVAARAHSFDTSLLPSQPAARARRGDKPRDGCKTPIASLDTSAVAHQQTQTHTEAGVLYMQDSDPVCKAPIIAWAPEAIRVGPAEALRQQEGALRVFDEATFFKDPLIGRDPFSSILLMTPDAKVAPRPRTVSDTINASSAGAATLPPLLAVSPSPTPRAAAERHEPIESSGSSACFPETDENESGDHHSSRDDEDEEEEEEVEEVLSPLPDGSASRRFSPKIEDISAIEVVCDPALLELRRNEAALASSSAPPPPPASASTATVKEEGENGLGSASAAHQPDLLTSHSDVSVPFATQPSLRESTVEALRSRKRRPLTSSEKVRQRMRKLKPVGNIVFRETAESSPLVTSPENTFNGDGRPAAPPPAPASPPLLPAEATRADANSLENTSRNDEEVFTDPSAGTQTQNAGGSARDGRLNDDAPPLPGHGAHTAGSAAAASSSSHFGENRDRVRGQIVSTPAAHTGCSSLDPAAYLNQEEERWSCIVEMLKPFEDVFGAKFRCELVRCVYDECLTIRPRLTEILRRLLHVVSAVLTGKEVAEGLTEEPMDLPLFGSILVSTSPVKVQELVFREEKCELGFCEEGTRLHVKLHVRRVRLEPIQFAYIDEADAARQNRAAQQSRLRTPQPRSRAAAWTLRHSTPQTYKDDITRGTAHVTATNVKLTGVVYVWLMASGKVYVTFQEAKVSVGSFKVSTDVAKLNVLFTLGAPILKHIVERAMLEAVKGVHSF